MIPLLFLILIVTIGDISCLVNVKISPRIVHGIDASECEFPYAVSLRYNTSHICGGTILNEKFILTAAHCVCIKNTMLLGFLNIQYGVLNISQEPVNTIKIVDIICNDYSPSETIVTYDAAVLELEKPLPEGNWSPVKLSKEFKTSNGSRIGTIIGWGKLRKNSGISTTLQKLNVEIYDDQICKKIVDLKHSICFGAPDAGACNVSVRNGQKEHFCGGTILNENHILTAAHCFCDELRPTGPFSVQYGSIYISKDDNRSIAISNVTCHENFQVDAQTFDVAVLKLGKRLPNGTWSAVQLSKDFAPKYFRFFYGRGTVVGWGLLWDGGPKSRILQKLNVGIYPDFVCKLKVNVDHNICTGQLFSGICPGDSGSALLVNGFQVGIASFITGRKCGQSSILTPDVFSRVPVYYDWIMSKVKEL